MTGVGLQQRLRTHIVLRLVVATVLLGSAFVVQVRAPGALPIDPFFLLIGATFAVSLALIASLRLVDRFPWMADVHFGIDALLVSAGVYLTGGLESLFTTLYVLPIVAASTVQLRRGGLQVATLSALLFVGVVLVQYAQAAGALTLPFGTAPGRDLPAISVALYTIGFNVFGFFAVALLSGSLAERARRADVRLERATEQIADLQAFNQYVLDNLLSGLATADAQNRLLTFNRSAMVITGRTGALPIGEPAADVLQLPGDFTAALADLGRVRSRRTDFEYRRADGRTIDLGLSVAALPLPDGGRGYLYTFQDVTETKRMERSARLQQRLAAVGEMAAGIAHEIRNPLASMSGSMQMLRQELPLSADQAQLMDIVLKESERLNQTIKSFLTYARPQKLRPQRLDLRTLVLETAALLRNSTEVREAQIVEVHVPEAGVPMEGDESQMRQILWNLATNGLRAMPDGGALRLSAREETAPDGQRLAVLEVADQGVGIPGDEIDLVFQPFRGSFGRGTGLGLAIVHRIVTDNHGRIDVQSAPGRGTTFTIRFARLAAEDALRSASNAGVAIARA
jgi:two-component system sensor histidine kinase PilS (NtrC family)